MVAEHLTVPSFFLSTIRKNRGSSSSHTPSSRKSFNYPSSLNNKEIQQEVLWKCRGSADRHAGPKQHGIGAEGAWSIEPLGVQDLLSVSLWNSDKHLGSNLDGYRRTEQMSLPLHMSRDLHCTRIYEITGRFIRVPYRDLGSGKNTGAVRVCSI